MPLVAVAYASRSGLAHSTRLVLGHIDGIKKAFGVVILLAGIAILSGADKWLEARVVGLLPDSWVALTVRF